MPQEPALSDLPILTDNIRVLQNAVVVPPEVRGGPIGVLDEDGNFVEESREYAVPFTPVAAPDPSIAARDLPIKQGTCLYAGWLHDHFGHVITESIARLWPLAAGVEGIEGIVFCSRGPKTIWRARSAHRHTISFFGKGIADLPVTHPVRFEKLIVADAACGIGARMQATPRFREYLASLPVPAWTGDPAKSIYLSRRKLGGQKGRTLGEDALWGLLEQNGYTEIHLQDMPLEQQISVIRQADRIVSPDGSPIHLASYFAHPAAQVAMIVRRQVAAPDQMAGQFRSLQGRDLLQIDAVKRIWQNTDSLKVNNTVLAEVDLPKIAKMLAAAGFISGPINLENLTSEDIAKEQTMFGRPKLAILP